MAPGALGRASRRLDLDLPQWSCRSHPTHRTHAPCSYEYSVWVVPQDGNRGLPQVSSHQPKPALITELSLNRSRRNDQQELWRRDGGACFSFWEGGIKRSVGMLGLRVRDSQLSVTSARRRLDVENNERAENVEASQGAWANFNKLLIYCWLRKKLSEYLKIFEIYIYFVNSIVRPCSRIF